MKPGKVKAGRTFVEALREKYVSLDAPEVAAEDSALPGAFVTTSKGAQKQIQFVGEKKLRWDISSK